MVHRYIMLSALAVAVGVSALACTKDDSHGVLEIPSSADAERGRALIEALGCGTCHRVPGIAGADGRVGPSLEDFGRQLYIAGSAPNTMANLALWLQDPDVIDPGTIMPSFGMNAEAAADIAAYLNEH